MAQARLGAEKDANSSINVVNMTNRGQVQNRINRHLSAQSSFDLQTQNLPKSGGHGRRFKTLTNNTNINVLKRPSTSSCYKDRFNIQGQSGSIYNYQRGNQDTEEYAS